jgi:hypothetical protein
VKRFIFCFAPFIFCFPGALDIVAQTGPAPGSEPSPMEALAAKPSMRTVWSSETGRLEGPYNTRAVITALVLGDGGQSAQRTRGVLIEVSGPDGKDRIYLDEEATERTRAALVEIADAVARRPMNGCIGAKEFWPLYDWPWNKLHELNADFCGDSLVLYGRGRPAQFRFPGKSPGDLSAILVSAIEQLKQH